MGGASWWRCNVVLDYVGGEPLGLGAGEVGGRVVMAPAAVAVDVGGLTGVPVVELLLFLSLFVLFLKKTLIYQSSL